ncbi:MAG: type III-B CRISPR module RAMP protein Cmr6 [Candidatus Methylumidiphilus sp.]
MEIAAVPNYISQAHGQNPFASAPPGHRFNLYFPIWQDHNWEMSNNKKAHAIKQVLGMEPVKNLLDNLLKRQTALAETMGANCHSIPARSTSPFATGLGLEHPVENGFSFLNPYGLPYLPGSGVKGVLRRAAEELALFDYSTPGADLPANESWTLLDVWWLFGFDASAVYLDTNPHKQADSLEQTRDAWRTAYKNHIPHLLEREDLPQFFKAIGMKQDKPTEQLLQDLSKQSREIHLSGSLSFWDVLPKTDKLAVEIMTPHYGDYYQGKSTPHDAGQPTPIPFLVVPAGSEFMFHVSFEDRPAIPDSIRQHWKKLLQAVFEHAFDWLGFGAKRQWVMACWKLISMN